MSRLKLHEHLILDLEGNYIEGAVIGNVTSEEAYVSLKYLTGQDFGYNADAWRKWFEENTFESAYQGLINRAKKRKD